MKHKKQDGIALAGIKMNAGKAGGRISGSILRFLMAVAGTYGAVFTLIKSLSMQLKPDVVMLMVLGMTAVFFLMFLSKKYLWFTTSMAFLLLSFFLLNEWEYLKNGLWCLENAYINSYNAYTGQRVLRYIIELDAERSLTTIFVPIVFLAALIFVMTVLGMAGKSVLTLITLPFVLAGLTVGMIPDAVPFLCYLSALIFVFGSERVPGSRKRSRTGISAAAGGTLAAAALGLMFLFHVLIPEERYPEKAIRDTKMEFLSAAENIDSERILQWFENSAFSGITDQLDRSGFLNLVGLSTVGDGGLGGGKLGRVDEVVFDYQTALRVQMPVFDQGFYLRGFVGVHYRGDRWDGLTVQEEKQLLELEQKQKQDRKPFVSRNQSALFYRLLESNERLRSVRIPWAMGGDSLLINSFSKLRGRVINVNANPYYYYLPYNVDYDSMEGLDSTVLYGKPENKNNTDYGFLFYSSQEEPYPDGLTLYPSSWENRGDADWDAYMKSEEEYAALVEQIYLEVPDGLEEVQKIAEELNKQAEQFETRFSVYYEEAEEKDRPAVSDAGRLADIGQKAELVTQYLKQNMSYTLSPGRLPAGKDFVSYFLTESRRGYCSYYASAGIVLLRMMGVPARYAEGYLVSGEDIAGAAVLGRQHIVEYGYGDGTNVANTLMLEIPVPDSNAHAWAEVYIRGYGWVPVEMTTGFADVLTGGIPETPAPESQSETMEDTPEETTQQETEQEITPSRTTQPAPDETVPEEEVPDGGDDGDDTPVSGQFELPEWVPVLLTILAAVLAAVLCCIAVVHSMERRMLRLYGQKDRNAAVLLLYKRCFRLFRLAVTIPEQNEDLPEYARELDLRLRRVMPLSEEADTCRFMDLAVKARFADFEASEEDREFVWKYYEALKDAFYQSATGEKRIFARYFLLMNRKI